MTEANGGGLPPFDFYKAKEHILEVNAQLEDGVAQPEINPMIYDYVGERYANPVEPETWPQDLLASIGNTLAAELYNRIHAATLIDPERFTPINERQRRILEFVSQGVDIGRIRSDPEQFMPNEGITYHEIDADWVEILKKMEARTWEQAVFFGFIRGDLQPEYVDPGTKLKAKYEYRHTLLFSGLLSGNSATEIVFANNWGPRRGFNFIERTRVLFGAKDNRHLIRKLFEYRAFPLRWDTWTAERIEESQENPKEPEPFWPEGNIRLTEQDSQTHRAWGIEAYLIHPGRPFRNEDFAKILFAEDFDVDPEGCVAMAQEIIERWFGDTAFNTSVNGLNHLLYSDLREDDSASITYVLPREIINDVGELGPPLTDEELRELANHLREKTATWQKEWNEKEPEAEVEENREAELEEAIEERLKAVFKTHPPGQKFTFFDLGPLVFPNDNTPNRASRIRSAMKYHIATIRRALLADGLVLKETYVAKSQGKPGRGQLMAFMVESATYSGEAESFLEEEHQREQGALEDEEAQQDEPEFISPTEQEPVFDNKSFKLGLEREVAFLERQTRAGMILKERMKLEPRVERILQVVANEDDLSVLAKALKVPEGEEFERQITALVDRLFEQFTSHMEQKAAAIASPVVSDRKAREAQRLELMRERGGKDRIEPPRENTRYVNLDLTSLGDLPPERYE